MDGDNTSTNSTQLHLKVCGMGTAENILEVASLKPDYLGFIFFEGSSRNFKGRIPPLPERIKKTGVFVNAPAEFILLKIRDYELQAVQLHGEESPEFCRNLKSQFPIEKEIKLIKVFSVKETFDFENLRPYEGIADLFLFDTKGENKGGNGIVFNWELLKEYPSSTPFFLSGGIGLSEIDTLKDFIGFLERSGKRDLLYGIDVNSKFETAPGQKSKLPLKKFKKEIFLK